MISSKNTELKISIKTLRGNKDIPFIYTFNKMGGMSLIVNEDEVYALIENYLLKNIEAQINADKDKMIVSENKAISNDDQSSSVEFLIPTALHKLSILPLELRPFLTSRITNLLNIYDLEAQANLLTLFMPAANVEEIKRILNDYISDIKRATTTNADNNASPNQSITDKLISGSCSLVELRDIYAIKLMPLCNSDLEDKLLCDAFNFFKLSSQEEIDKHIYLPEVKQLGKLYIEDYVQSIKRGGCSSCKKNSLLMKYKSLLSNVLLKINK